MLRASNGYQSQYTDYKPGVRRLDIADFNAMSELQAQAALTRCCGSRRWVQGMMARRPFASFAALFAASDEVWWSLDRSDWLEAFNHHLQIGEWFSGKNGFSNYPAEPVSDVILEGLARGNHAYHKKFGYTFVIKKAGQLAADLLTQLQKRLRHNPETEILIAADQNKQIMTDRLMRWVTS